MRQLHGKKAQKQENGLPISLCLHETILFSLQERAPRVGLVGLESPRLYAETYNRLQLPAAQTCRDGLSVRLVDSRGSRLESHVTIRPS